MHFAISHRPTRGSISSYNIAGLISEVFEEVATQSAKNCRRQPPHSHLRPPPTGTPANIRIYLIFPEPRVIGLHFCRCSYGSIFIQICALGSKRRIFYAPECVLAVEGHSGSSKVDDFGTNRKRVCDFLFNSPPLWLWCYLAPFLRYGDLLAKNCLFFLLLSHSAPSLPMFPLEFCREVKREVLESWGYPPVKTAWS